MDSWMMLPLEVLPGWPQPEQTSNLHLLLLALIGPVAVGLVIMAITWTPTLMKRSTDEAEAEGLGPATITPEERAALEVENAPRRAALGATAGGQSTRS